MNEGRAYSLGEDSQVQEHGFPVLRSRQHGRSRKALLEIEEGFLAFLGPLEGCLFAQKFENGRACCTDFAMNRESKVSMLFRTGMDFFELGVGSSKNSRHLSGLASIPRSVR